MRTFLATFLVCAAVALVGCASDGPGPLDPPSIADSPDAEMDPVAPSFSELDGPSLAGGLPARPAPPALQPPTAFTPPAYSPPAYATPSYDAPVPGGYTAPAPAPADYAPAPETAPSCGGGGGG